MMNIVHHMWMLFDNAILLATCAGILWGVYPPLLTRSLRDVGQMASFVVMSVAAGVAALLIFVVSPKIRTGIGGMSMSTWALLLASSLLGPILAAMLFSSALAKRPHNPGVVVAVAFTLPVLISTLVSWIWFDAFKIDAYDVVGMVLIIAGVITLAMKQPNVDVRIQ